MINVRSSSSLNGSIHAQFLVLIIIVLAFHPAAHSEGSTVSLSLNLLHASVKIFQSNKHVGLVKAQIAANEAIYIHALACFFSRSGCRAIPPFTATIVDERFSQASVNEAEFISSDVP
jgi:hypothetical protein